MPPADRMRATDILIVDDDVQLAGSLSAFLRLHGYEVVEFHDGRPVQDYLRHSRVALVISDIFMPDCDGIELMNFIRRLPAPPVLLAISGTDNNRVIGMLKIVGMLGAARTLTKPFAPADLLALVRELIGAPLSERRPGELRDPAGR